MKYSEPLANKYYLRAEDYTLDDLVSEVLRVVKPLTAEATAQAETGTVSITATAYIVGQPGVPTDALPRQPHLAQFQPCLTFQFSQPQAVNGKFYLEWVVKNIGLGAARKVKSFLPGVFTDKLESPIEAGANASRGVLYENKRAFTNFMKPPVHLIAEYEDIAGNIYRQYGNLIQSPAPSGAFNFYGVEEMGTPYLISERIVKA